MKTREEMLDWLVENVEVWPNCINAPALPADCGWSWFANGAACGPGLVCTGPTPQRLGSIYEYDWETSRQPDGLEYMQQAGRTKRPLTREQALEYCADVDGKWGEFEAPQGWDWVIQFGQSLLVDGTSAPITPIIGYHDVHAEPEIPEGATHRSAAGDYYRQTGGSTWMVHLSQGGFTGWVQCTDQNAVERDIRPEVIGDPAVGALGSVLGDLPGGLSMDYEIPQAIVNAIDAGDVPGIGRIGPLVEMLESVIKASPLWLPVECEPEHQGECEALTCLHSSITQLLGVYRG